MTKLKASNVFENFAPTGGGSKIADFGSALKAAANTKATSTANVNVGSSPNGSSSSTSSNSGGMGAAPVSPINNPGNGPKKDNTWIYVIVGVALIGGIYLWHRHKNKTPNYPINRKPEEKKGDTNKS